ncbi:MAG: methyl-accepting chemotaxis protein [Candidatus Riflebacteria bacterium]|nr:methyl-accepting chemotaxis protein [Candidatus Riflebacteria bacterium]
MTKISLQTKIVLLAFFLVITPIIIANLIFSFHRVIFQTRGVITGAKGICGQMKNIGETPSREEIAEMPLESFQISPEELAEMENEEEKDKSGEEGEEGDEEEDEEGGKPAKKAAKPSDEDVEIVEKSEEDGDEGEEGEEGEEKTEKASSKVKPRFLTEEELIQAKNKAIAEADSIIEIKSQEARCLDEFISSKYDDLDKLDNAIKSLEICQRIFFYGSSIFVLFAIGILWFFITHSTSPFKNITERLKSFQNEKDKVSQDMLECAIQFDSFLATAKTLLQESYSIAQEIGRKLEPLTVMSVFSDDNVKQFFTDVQEISRSSNYIANTLDSTTAHIQEVSASAQTIADRSHEAATDSAETAAIAGEGKNAVSETIDTMESIKDEVLGLEDVIENLNSASKQIGEIVNTITNIAYQTNLLALNAAIEAARAGEHGQGFTVVANEVKKLAEESGEAAEDISKKIKEMLTKTGKAVETINRGATKVIEGVNIANLAGNNLDKIVTSVANVNKMIQDISNASTEQSQNIDSLRGSIESITGATKITSEGTKRVASAVNEQLAHIRQYINVTKELLTLVQMMGDMLDKFNLN